MCVILDSPSAAITPLPVNARTLPHRLVFPDAHMQHSPQKAW